MYKKEFFVRYGYNIKRPALLGEVDNDQKRAYIVKHLLPKDEFESFVTLGLSYFHNRYLTLYDYDNYKLQELKRLGPTLTVSNDFAFRTPLMSDRVFYDRKENSPSLSNSIVIHLPMDRYRFLIDLTGHLPIVFINTA